MLCNYTKTYKNHIIFILLFFIFSNQCFAADLTSANGLLSTVQDKITTAMSQWLTYFEKIALYLLYSLCTISIVWRFGQMMLRQSDLGEIVLEIIKTVMILGVFVWFITNIKEIATTIYISFFSIALTVNEGNSQGLDPSAILTWGLELAGEIWSGIGMGIIDGITRILAAFIVVVVFCFIAINVLITTLTFFFNAYAGIIIVGLAGSDWTRDWALTWLRAMIASSVKVFAMLLILNIVGTVFEDILNDFKTTEDSWMVAATAITSSILFFLLVTQIPQTFASMVSHILNPTVNPGRIAASAAQTAVSVAAPYLAGAGRLATRGAGVAAKAGFNATLGRFPGVGGAVKAAGDAAKNANSQFISPTLSALHKAATTPLWNRDAGAGQGKGKK